jgi:hypothetical protein
MLYFAMLTLKIYREHSIQTPLDIMGAKNVNLGSVDTRKSYLIIFIFQNFLCLNLGPKICQYIYEYKEIAFYNTGTYIKGVPHIESGGPFQRSLLEPMQTPSRE